MTERINGLARRVPSAAVYLLCLLPAPYFLYLAATGGLGVEPITALEHAYGELALQLLIAGLAVTPLRRFAGINLLKFRRAIGLCAFSYVVLHTGVWAILDVQALDRVWADVVKRPYITIGMAALVLMLPLALTSNDLSVRRLGARWRSLHKLTYAAGLLGAVHFVMLGKGFQVEPLLYIATMLGLLAVRLVPRRKPARRAAHPA